MLSEFGETLEQGVPELDAERFVVAADDVGGALLYLDQCVFTLLKKKNDAIINNITKDKIELI